MVFLRNGIVFMVVTTGTLHGHTQKSSAECIGPIFYVFYSVLLRDNSPFKSNFVISIETCGQNLFFGGIGELVSCQLIGDKSVIGHILFKGMNNPIPPRPHSSFKIVLITMGVCISRDGQPFGSHMLCIII